MKLLSCLEVRALVYNILLSFLCQISCITWRSCRKCSNNIWESCGSRLQTDMGSVSGRLTWYFLVLLHKNIVLHSAVYGNETILIVKTVILQLLVNKTLYEKTLASGFGSVHFLLDASEQQQVRSFLSCFPLSTFSVSIYNFDVLGEGGNQCCWINWLNKWCLIFFLMKLSK